jgi:hypothetical protein
MAWQDYIDSEILQLNARHVSGAFASIVGFSFITWVTEHLTNSLYVLSLVHLADNIVITSCIIYLTVAILWALGGKLVKLLKGRSNAPSFVGA